MFCENCGKNISDNAISCPQCGWQTSNNDDTGNFGWLCLGFCIPIVGIVLWAIWRKEKPKNAKKAIIGFLMNVGLNVIFYVIYILMIVMALSMESYY